MEHLKSFLKSKGQKEKLIPKGWIRYITPFYSGVMVWIRVPYNLLKGVSLKDCIKQERLDLWNVGLKYRLIFSPSDTQNVCD